jgi:hypothetical protein
LKKLGTDVCGMVGTFSAVALVCAMSDAPPRSATAAADNIRRVSILMTPPALGCYVVSVKIYIGMA